MERRRFLYSALAAASLAAIPAARSSAAATTTARREGSAPMTPSQRQNPMSCNGMVTSPHYLASQAGLDILRRGGTAIDAAVATAATLAVVYPQMCTLGGDNFWLIYDARTGKMKGLNASGRAGEKASIDFYRSRGLSRVPARGYLAANTVPGVVSGWDEAWKYSRSALGSQLSFASLLDTARELAERGFPVSTSLAYWSGVDTDPTDQEFRDLQRYPGFAAAYLRDGKPYGLGEVMRLPELAATLALLADKGADEFYKGSIAAAIAADLEENGGLLTVRDFARHTADWVEPISVPYRDCRAWNLPPNTQGMASLEILNILNNFDLSQIREGSADYYHLIIEATKEAFLDRDTYLSDPAFVDIPLERLLSDGHGKRQAARIRMDRAATSLAPLDPKGDTIWLGVVDGQGNAVSLIQSIYHDFGSGIVPRGTGVLLQNRGSFFSLDPAHVNRLEPGKRTFHTLNPAMLTRNGKPFLVYGTMGGEGQPQTQAAIATRVLDYGMTPQEAIDAPRWLYGRTWGKSSNDLKLEGRISADVADELARRGHPVRRVEDYTDTMGHAGAIRIDPQTGVLQGGTDPRGDGLACGY